MSTIYRIKREILKEIWRRSANLDQFFKHIRKAFEQAGFRYFLEDGQPGPKFRSWFEKKDGSFCQEYIEGASE